MGAEEQRDYIASLKREQIALRSGLDGARRRVPRRRLLLPRLERLRGDRQHARHPAAHLSRARRCGRSAARIRPAASRCRSPATRRSRRPGLNATPPVAVLDTGVDTDALNGHADPGYDAVDRDRDPKPGRRPRPPGDQRDGARGRDRRRRRARAADPDRLAAEPSGGATEAVATTDQLIAGLEHAVDPNGDGDTSDHVPVALVGVNAPYAGLHQLARGRRRRRRRRPRHAGGRARRQRGRRGAGQRDDRLARLGPRRARRRRAHGHRADPADEPHARRRRARRGRRAGRRPARRRQDRRPGDRHRPGRARPRDRRASATRS